MYRVTDQDTVTLLDKLDLDLVLNQGDEAREPRIDRQSGRVYISRLSDGVRVVRYDSSKLVSVTTLRCVGKAGSLGVVSPDTLGRPHLDCLCLCL